MASVGLELCPRKRRRKKFMDQGNSTSQEVAGDGALIGQADGGPGVMEKYDLA